MGDTATTTGATDVNGQVSVTLYDPHAEPVKVTAKSVTNTSDAGQSKSVTYTADATTARVSTLVATTDSGDTTTIPADGKVSWSSPMPAAQV